jgi:hypothetical protein
MTINELLKEMKKYFPNMEYKATSKEGLVFKSKGWTDYENKKNTAHYTK